MIWDSDPAGEETSLEPRDWDAAARVAHEMVAAAVDRLQRGEGARSASMQPST